MTRGISTLVVVLALDACSKSSPVQPSCTYSISPTSLSWTASGGEAAVSVTSGESCSWRVATTGNWLSTPDAADRAGTGTLRVIAAVNDTATTRSASVLIGDRTLAVTQAGRVAPCTFDVSPSSQSFDATGGAGVVHVVAGASCAWTSSTTATWIRLSTTGNTGSADVPYTVGTNGDPVARTATLLVAGVVVTIAQAAATPAPPEACTFAVAPTEFALHWHGPGGDVRVTTEPGCPWTVQPAADWLRVTTGGSSGSASVTFLVTEYVHEATRRAPLQVRWDTPTAGQNVWVTQEGCRYGLSLRLFNAPADGGPFTLDVFGDPVSSSCSIGCPWTATPSASWVQVTSSMPRSGDDRLVLTVDANGSSTPRTATVAIGDAVLTVIQNGR